MDIAGDVAVQIGGVLVDALAGVEAAWVDTIDYLADTWSIFVAQVKSMWNSTVGFLRKAWIKLKSLFDDDVNVEVEMAKIDKDMRAADAAEDQKKQQAINDRLQRRQQRKQQIEQNRIQMQAGIKQQLEARQRARAMRDVDAEMQAIDADAAQKNAAVDQTRKQEFQANAAAGAARQGIIDNTTTGVQATLAQMREEARREREAKRQSPEERQAARDQEVAAAQADFDAAVEAANKVGADAAGEEPPANQKPLKPPHEPKAPNAKLGELKPPDKKDLQLKLDPKAKDSIDGFGSDVNADHVEAAGNFDARGLSLGSGASNIPHIVIQPEELKTEAAAKEGEEDKPAVPQALAPEAPFMFHFGPPADLPEGGPPELVPAEPIAEMPEAPGA